MPPAPLQKYLRLYADAACKQFNIPRWMAGALLAHVQAQEKELTDLMGALRCAAVLCKHTGRRWASASLQRQARMAPR